MRMVLRSCSTSLKSTSGTMIGIRSFTLYPDALGLVVALQGDNTDKAI